MLDFNILLFDVPVLYFALYKDEYSYGLSKFNSLVFMGVVEVEEEG